MINKRKVISSLFRESEKNYIKTIKTVKVLTGDKAIKVQYITLKKLVFQEKIDYKRIKQTNYLHNSPLKEPFFIVKGLTSIISNTL